MMSNPWVVLAVTVVIIAASAFFVAIEFALLAARRHRLEDAAPHSRAARAALRSSSELTVLLGSAPPRSRPCTTRSRRCSRAGACRTGWPTPPGSSSRWSS